MKTKRLHEMGIPYGESMDLAVAGIRELAWIIHEEYSNKQQLVDRQEDRGFKEGLLG